MTTSTDSEPNNHREELITLNAGLAQLYVLGFMIPPIILMILPFGWLYPDAINQSAISSAMPDGLDFIVVILLGVVAHELVHGISWSLFCKKGFRSIKFGVIWKYLTPYCHCKEMLEARHYRIGALMPAIIVGLVPYFISLLTGNTGLFLFGLFFTFGAGGDFLILWMLRKTQKHTLVKDHPTKIGCIVYHPIE